MLLAAREDDAVVARVEVDEAVWYLVPSRAGTRRATRAKAGLRREPTWAPPPSLSPSCAQACLARCCSSSASKRPSHARYGAVRTIIRVATLCDCLRTLTHLWPACCPWGSRRANQQKAARGKMPLERVVAMSRAHGNTSEYAPFMAILFLLVNHLTRSQPGMFLNLVMVCGTVARVASAVRGRGTHAGKRAGVVSALTGVVGAMPLRVGYSVWHREPTAGQRAKPAPVLRRVGHLRLRSPAVGRGAVPARRVLGQLSNVHVTMIPRGKCQVLSEWGHVFSCRCVPDVCVRRGRGLGAERILKLALHICINCTSAIASTSEHP